MLNSVAISGRLVREPEMAENSSIPICRFTLAVQDNYKGKDGNYGTNFIDCTAFNQKGEFICKNFSKGDLMIVCGSIKTGSYKDKDGNNKKTFGITAAEVHFCQNKQTKENDGDFKKVGFTTEEDLPF